MWIDYDLQYQVLIGDERRIQRDIGIINSDKIQCMEITDNALYIYISESYHFKFVHEPMIIFEAFKKVICSDEQYATVKLTFP